MSGSVSIESGNEDSLQKALAYIGPIAVAVDASSNAFKVLNTLTHCTKPEQVDTLPFCSGCHVIIHNSLTAQCI